MKNAPPGWVGRFLGWLGTLSVSRKLTLIYLLDLTAVIYISGILIHEKYLAIDFARKEIVGVNYTDAVRQVMMGSALPAAAQPGESGQSLQRLAQARAAWDPDLGTVAVSPQIIETVQVIQSGTSRPAGSADLSPLFAQGRTLVTAVGNQSNLILDPDLDSYYVMSLTVLRYPELLQVMHETVEFLKTYRSEAFPG